MRIKGELKETKILREKTGKTVEEEFKISQVPVNPAD